MDEDEVKVENQSDFDFSVVTILENYGWFILIVAIALFYVYRQLQPTIDKYLQDRANKEYSAKYHKDPDLAVMRIAAQQEITQKLQEKYNTDAEQYRQKIEEKAAKKREEWLAKQCTSSGQKLGNYSTTKEEQSLKPEYNPLTGGTSRSYRPQRRSACSGGGCGR